MGLRVGSDRLPDRPMGSGLWVTGRIGYPISRLKIRLKFLLKILLKIRLKILSLLFFLDFFKNLKKNR